MSPTEPIYRTSLVYAQYTNHDWDAEATIPMMLADLLALADEYSVDLMVGATP